MFVFDIASFFIVRPAWVQSNGYKSRTRVDSAKYISKGNGAHCEVESEGIRRQTSDLTNRNYEKTGEPVTKAAKELGLKPTTLHGWISKYKNSPEVPFSGSGHLRQEDEILRKLERE